MRRRLLVAIWVSVFACWMVGRVGRGSFTAPAVYISKLKLRPGDTNGFPPWHMVIAEQLPNSTCEIQTTGDAPPRAGSPWSFVAGYGCWYTPNTGVVQTVLGSYPNHWWEPQWAFFRSVNTDCGTSLFPRMAEQLIEEPELNLWLRAWRGTNCYGRRIRIGPEIVPVQTNGVRRFIGVID